MQRIFCCIKLNCHNILNSQVVVPPKEIYGAARLAEHGLLFSTVPTWVNVVRSDCDAKKAEHCMYNSLSRSCLGFVQDAFKVTGLDGHFVDYFTKEQVNQFNISNYQAAYATKANLYASFNKFFSPVSHILLSDMPDPIIGDNNVIISADEE